MTCVPILEKRKTTPVSYKQVGFVCGFEPEYKFEGYLFEVHHYLGPIPLRKTDHSPRKNIPSGFWAMWERFEKLSKTDRKQYLTEGK